MVWPLNAIASAESMISARVGESTRGGSTRPLVWGEGGGFGGISPEKIFKSKMSVEVFLRPFMLVTLGFIVQTLHDAVFKSVSNSVTKYKSMNTTRSILVLFSECFVDKVNEAP